MWGLIRSLRSLPKHPQQLETSETTEERQLTYLQLVVCACIISTVGGMVMFAISFTLHSGFLGGFILPLFSIGANVGRSLALSVPQIHPKSR